MQYILDDQLHIEMLQSIISRENYISVSGDCFVLENSVEPDGIQNHNSKEVNANMCTELHRLKEEK